jgi:hypothetical protein
MRINWIRSPKTTPEIRHNAAIEADIDMLNLGVTVRPRRRAKNLPTNWEDAPKETGRCWKRYRRTQYKAA